VVRHYSSARIEAFSDGVLAIAITLLVLEISVPEGSLHNLGKAIVDQWPSYLAYVTSFLTIGAVWLAHHGLFQRIRQADAVVVRANLVLLMTVSFLPFPTRLLAESITDREAERAAVLFYGAVLLTVLTILTAMCRYVASRAEMLREPSNAPELRALALQLSPGLGFYVLGLPIALLAPRVAAFWFLGIAVVGVLRAPGESN
jgi:uncharacterized membrane protein